MRATTEELIIFVTVVESGSFSRAAERLSQANSVVSRAVKRLEMKLGVTLLNRTTRQLNLTEEGERYFRDVQKILQAMTAAENELIESRHTPRGLLRVDAATPVLLNLIIPLIKPFRERYPDITLSLVSSETFINLIDRKVDIAIRSGHLSDSSLRARPLFIGYRKLIAAPEYLAQHGVPTRVSDLENHTCLGFTEPQRLNQWPVPLPDGQLIEVIPGLSSNSGETLKQLCLQGNGIACLSEFMVNEEIKQGKFVELFAEQRLPIEMPLSAVYYSDHAVSSRIRVFVDFISEWFATTQAGMMTHQTS